MVNIIKLMRLCLFYSEFHRVIILYSLPVTLSPLSLGMQCPGPELQCLLKVKEDLTSILCNHQKIPIGPRHGPTRNWMKLSQNG